MEIPEREVFLSQSKFTEQEFQKWLDTPITITLPLAKWSMLNGGLDAFASLLAVRMDTDYYAIKLQAISNEIGAVIEAQAPNPEMYRDMTHDSPDQ